MIELKHNTEAFLPEAHPRICILNTDITEPEIMIRQLAACAAREYPDAFSGEAPQVFFRMRYTPPYETFQEIRKLILQIRSATGVRSCFHGIITVDVSEYKGHEDEEYFTILLKYLYDNTKGSKTVFVCSRYTDKEIRNLMNACMRFFPIQYEQIFVYEHNQLKTLIKAAFSKCRLRTDSESIELMADLLGSEDLSDYRTLQLIERLPEEFRRMTKSGLYEGQSDSVSVKTVRDYFEDSHSPLCMLAGHALLEGKEGTYEHTL